MQTILYETESAVFAFNRNDVRECVNRIISEHQVQEASDLLTLNTQSQEPEIRIPEQKSCFGHIVLDLISHNKGTEFCKACQESCRPDELSRFPIGHGRSPFGANVLQKEGVFNRMKGLVTGISPRSTSLARGVRPPASAISAASR